MRIIWIWPAMLLVHEIGWLLSSWYILRQCICLAQRNFWRIHSSCLFTSLSLSRSLVWLEEATSFTWVLFVVGDFCLCLFFRHNRSVRNKCGENKLSYEFLFLSTALTSSTKKSMDSATFVNHKKPRFSASSRLVRHVHVVRASCSLHERSVCLHCSRCCLIHRCRHSHLMFPDVFVHPHIPMFAQCFSLPRPRTSSALAVLRVIFRTSRLR